MNIAAAFLIPLASAALASATNSADLQIGCTLDRQESVTIQLPAKAEKMTIFIAGGAEHGMLEGKILQTAGGLAVPAKEAAVECAEAATGPAARFWKVSLRLPSRKEPATYVVILELVSDNRVIVSRLITLNLADPDSKPPKS